MPEAIKAQEPNLARWIARIADALSPHAIYLFGSRARGTPHETSDYDLLVVVSDDTPSERLAPERIYRLAREIRVPADIVTCRKSGFDQSRDEVGTLSYEVAHSGKLVYGR